VSLALREAVQDDFFYDETDEDAQAAWRDARAVRICTLLDALRHLHGRVTLDWLRPMETWAALRALLALPGVTLATAATLLLFELQRPLLPIDWNTLQEAKGLGWVPPQSSAEAAFLHLHQRLPEDATLRRRIYDCLSQQNVFRLTRRAVVGDGEKGGVHDGLRQRRATLTVHLDLRSRDSAAKADAEEGDEMDDPVDALAVTAGPYSVASRGLPDLPLRDFIAECMQWHKLFPEAGVTPALVVLRPLDARAALNAAAAFASGGLPQQQEDKDDGYSLRYVVDVHWSADELLACALLVGEAPSSEGELPELRRHLQSGASSVAGESALFAGAGTGAGAGAGGGGALLFGFGGHLENGLHLAATTNRPLALRALWEHAKSSATTGLDVRGRSALHSAALSGAAEVASELLRLGVDPRAGDREGVLPIAVAAAAGQPVMCELLLKAAPETVNLGDRRPLELAAASGAIDAVRLLLAHGAAIDGQPKSGKTALHAASRAAQVDVARHLVDVGASITLHDLSDRLAYEVVPDDKAAEFAWLTELSKRSRKDAPKPKLDPLARLGLDVSDW